eukprot:scaffold18324_cov176-Amphora_coffeaeformis.AAC.13
MEQYQALQPASSTRHEFGIKQTTNTTHVIVLFAGHGGHGDSNQRVRHFNFLDFLIINYTGFFVLAIRLAICDMRPL